MYRFLVIFFGFFVSLPAYAGIVWQSNTQIVSSPYLGLDNVGGDVLYGEIPINFTEAAAFEIFLDRRYRITGIGANFIIQEEYTQAELYLLRTDLEFYSDDFTDPVDPTREITFDLIMRESLVSGVVAIPPIESDVGVYFDDFVVPADVIAEPGRYILAIGDNQTAANFDSYPVLSQTVQDRSFDPLQSFNIHTCDGAKTLYTIPEADAIVLPVSTRRDCVRAFINGNPVEVSEPPIPLLAQLGILGGVLLVFKRAKRIF